MRKISKNTKTKGLQNIIAKMMKKISNSNIEGDMSFAQLQAKRDETFNHLYNAILPMSNRSQAQNIVNIVKLGIRGNECVDAMPIMAVGDVMAFMRQEVRKAIKEVRSYKAIESVIELDKARAYQHYEDMLAVYLMVNKAYYTLYNRFMAEINKPKLGWKA